MNNPIDCRFTPENPENSRSVTILKARKALGTWSAEYCTASLERVINTCYGLAGIATNVITSTILTGTTST